MATKTYLELVNSVLVRLRENTVGAVAETAYSTLIGAWVNDAKRLVEDAWDWEALIGGVTTTLAASTQDYVPPNLNERSRLCRNVVDPRLPMAFDITPGDPFQLLDAPHDWIVEQRELLAANPNNQAKPIYFSVNKTSAGGINIALYEVPTAVRTWRMYFVRPQADLSSDSDVLSIPYAPVILIALDTALNERGEEIGEPGSTVEQRANMHIANAIAIDAQDQPHKTTFYPG